jgi:fructose 1,6-bisphosphate aldolase/phosphatase
VIPVITLSIIKAETGGFVGHSAMHPDMLALAKDAVTGAIGDLLVDGRVSSCGDDLHLLMTHRHGADADVIHAFAWEVFQRTTELARELGLYGAGQDLLSDAFSAAVPHVRRSVQHGRPRDRSDDAQGVRVRGP